MPYAPTPLFRRKPRHKDRRGGARARGYSRRWERERRIFLARHPLCVHCLAAGRTRAAEVVDHIVPHRGDSELFWDGHNWQALCKACHDRKTGRGQ